MWLLEAVVQVQLSSGYNGQEKSFDLCMVAVSSQQLPQPGHWYIVLPTTVCAVAPRLCICWNNSVVLSLWRTAEAAQEVQ